MVSVSPATSRSASNGKLPLMKGRLHLAPLLNMHGEAVAVTAVSVRSRFSRALIRRKGLTFSALSFLPSQDGLGWPR